MSGEYSLRSLYRPAVVALCVGVSACSPRLSLYREQPAVGSLADGTAGDARVGDATWDAPEGPPGSWFKSFGSLLGDAGRDVLVDNAGNVVVAGSFIGKMDFGGGVIRTDPAGDAFVASYDSHGRHRWSTRLGGPGRDQIVSIATGRIGEDVFVAVCPEKGSAFDWHTDVHLLRLNGAGEQVWFKEVGGPGTECARSIAVDASSRVSITGSFGEPVDFGGGELTGVGRDEVYLAQFDGDGEHLWSHSFNGTVVSGGIAIAANDDGRLACTGSFSGSLTFGSTKLSSKGNNDVFLAVFDAAGNSQWAKRFGDADADHGYSVAVDTAGNVYVTGAFTGTQDFGGGPRSSGADRALFLASYDPQGAYRWASVYGSLATAAQLALDAQRGAVVVLGTFAGTIDLGAGPWTAVGSSDTFVLTVDSATGAYRSGRHFDWGEAQERPAIAVAGDGALLIAGSYKETADFGFGEQLSEGGKDAFLIRLSPPEPR